MTDLLTRLHDARPGPDELEHLWPEAQSARLLDQILAGEAERRHRHRRRAGIALVAAATTAVLVLPTGVDTPSASAADLRALALSAAAYDGPVLAEGSWLHVRTTSLQRNSATLRPREVPTIDAERETWTRWDGRQLVIEQRPSAGWTTYDVIDGSADISDVDAPPVGGRASYQDPTPEFAASLPDSADGLLAYLDGRVFGSSSHDEALYSALTGLATSHTLPPRTLAATFEALAQVDGVRTEDVRGEGGPAVEIGFEDRVTSSSETIVVDRVTGQALAVRQRSRLGDYTSTTTLSQVVPAVPTDVLAAFDTYEEGVRYDQFGAALPD